MSSGLRRHHGPGAPGTVGVEEEMELFGCPLLWPNQLEAKQA